MSSTVASGASAVAAAIVTKPPALKSAAPIGAPSARAANIAIPAHAITRPAFSGPARERPQLTAPVIIKLSAPPSSARPASRMLTEIHGVPAKGSESR